MNTNITKTWTIEISGDEIFARCTNESLCQAYLRTAENSKGDAVVMQEDDRDMFTMYYGNAIANLKTMLARRMEGSEATNSGYDFTFVLGMHDNHDDNILPILKNHCYEYLTRKVLEQWYRADLGSEMERLEVLHCIHYRKHPVRRRIGPLF